MTPQFSHRGKLFPVFTKSEYIYIPTYISIFLLTYKLRGPTLPVEIFVEQISAIFFEKSFFRFFSAYNTPGHLWVSTKNFSPISVQPFDRLYATYIWMSCFIIYIYLQFYIVSSFNFFVSFFGISLCFCFTSDVDDVIKENYYNYFVLLIIHNTTILMGDVILG